MIASFFLIIKIRVFDLGKIFFLWYDKTVETSKIPTKMQINLWDLCPEKMISKFKKTRSFHQLNLNIIVTLL